MLYLLLVESLLAGEVGEIMEEVAAGLLLAVTLHSGIHVNYGDFVIEGFQGRS